MLVACMARLGISGQSDSGPGAKCEHRKSPDSRAVEVIRFRRGGARCAVIGEFGCPRGRDESTEGPVDEPGNG